MISEDLVRSVATHKQIEVGVTVNIKKCDGRTAEYAVNARCLSNISEADMPVAAHAIVAKQDPRDAEVGEIQIRVAVIVDIAKSEPGRRRKLFTQVILRIVQNRDARIG